MLVAPDEFYACHVCLNARSFLYAPGPDWGNLHVNSLRNGHSTCYDAPISDWRNLHLNVSDKRF